MAKLQYSNTAPTVSIFAYCCTVQDAEWDLSKLLAQQLCSPGRQASFCAGRATAGSLWPLLHVHSLRRRRRGILVAVLRLHGKVYSCFVMCQANTKDSQHSWLVAAA